MSLTDRIILAAVLSVAACVLLRIGYLSAPLPRIGDHDVPAHLHCQEDNVLRLTPQGIICDDGGR